jgi:hypothetical protein
MKVTILIRITHTITQMFPISYHIINVIIVFKIAIFSRKDMDMNMRNWLSSMRSILWLRKIDLFKLKNCISIALVLAHVWLDSEIVRIAVIHDPNVHLGNQIKRKYLYAQVTLNFNSLTWIQNVSDDALW